MIDIILLAGGKGTRLKKIWDGQKCLIPVNGVPFLAYVLDQCKDFKRVMSVGYKGNDVVNFIRNSDFRNIDIIKDSRMNGTFDAVKQAASLIEADNFLVANADTLFNIDLKSFYDSHIKSGKMISAALKIKEEDVGNFMQEDENLFWTSYRKRGLSFLNSGVYCVNKKVLKFDLSGSSFDKVLNHFNPNVELFNDFFVDIGTVNDYNTVNHFYKRFDGFYNYPGGE